MKNGNVYDFVDHLYFGDELWFFYHGRKYFLEGWMQGKRFDLHLYEMAEHGKKYIWMGDESGYPVDQFLQATIWDGKNFWHAEKDMEWVDD